MDQDTTLGGNARKFPQTQCALIVAAAGVDPQARARALEALIAAYWKPAYTYLRIRWSAGNEEAKDLVQGFFASVIETGMLARYDQTKARFRTYLRTCLDGFVANQRQAARRLKRGGGAVHLPIDPAEIGDIADRADAGAIFERECVRELFAHAVEALRARCEATGKGTAFALFARLDIDGPNSGEKPSYVQLSLELGLPVTQVNNHLAFARREFRKLVLEHLRESTTDDAEFRAESRRLLGVEPR